MPTFEIKNLAGRVIFLCEAEDWKSAIEQAVKGGANLSGANLRGANLSDAYLSDAYLSDANLRGANLSGANLSDAYLRGANLRGAYLSGANLSGANLSDAYLSDAYLSDANLRGANLSGANLSDANLSGANLSGANLSDAYLSDAYLSGAYLRGANLSDATILDTRETWHDYLNQTLPALLAAGGKSIADIVGSNCWDCHDWSNCPMAFVFDVKSESQAPILLRPRVRQFVALFDAKLIPCPTLPAESEAPTDPETKGQ